VHYDWFTATYGSFTKGLTLGQCIVDLANSWKLDKNAYVAMDMDVRKCNELFMEVCFGKEVKENIRFGISYFIALKSFEEEEDTT
jgi:hypothetical protein